MVPRDGRASLVYAGGVKQLAAAGAGDGLLAGAVLAEPGVLGLGVRADGPQGGFAGAWEMDGRFDH